jgi:nicotinate-nucleotide adenylyltransferase
MMKPSAKLANRSTRISPLSSALWHGKRVGLFGGTFNPPHEGHVYAATLALKYLSLDCVWWMVSPGNPLKANHGLPDVGVRINASRALISHPRILVSDIESQLNTYKTCDTVKKLQHHFPQTDFIWIGGYDLAAQFHHWNNWQAIIKALPFAFIGRETASGMVRANTFRRLPLKQHHVNKAIRPKLSAGHVYWLDTEPLNPLSSTALRQNAPDLP